MLPLKLNLIDTEAERARWRVIRLDNFAALPGVILSADVETGLALMQVRSKTEQDIGQEEFALGPHGLRIVVR